MSYFIDLLICCVCVLFYVGLIVVVVIVGIGLWLVSCLGFE